MPPHTPSRMPPRTCTHCAIFALTSDAATPPTHRHHLHPESRHTPPTPCQRRRHLHHRERDRIAERRRRTPPSILYFGRGGALHSCEDGRPIYLGLHGCTTYQTGYNVIVGDAMELARRRLKLHRLTDSERHQEESHIVW